MILENITCVRSIFLTGGFGKREGSVETTQNGKVRFLRDFDFAVIVDRIPKEETVKKLYDQIYRSLGLPNPEGKLFRFSNFVVDIKFLTKKDLIYPDIWFYDLKVASHLLYGEDVRNLIPTNKIDIPTSSGLRILFEKVCGLLGNFSYSYLKTKKIPIEKKKVLIFECYKTFIEMCTALSILAGEYEPKYVTRAKNLENIYWKEFPKLCQVLPNLPKKVIAYTNFKLRPDFTKVSEDPVELWFSARESLGATLRFYLRRYLAIALSDWNDLSFRMKIVARHYYKPFLQALMYRNWGFSNSTMLDIVSFLYQTLTNIEYAYVVSMDMGRVYPNPLRKFYISPSLKFFQAGVMILFSLEKDGTVEKELLGRAIEELRHCVPVKIHRLDASGWDISRKYFLKAYSLYRGYHFVK